MKKTVKCSLQGISLPENPLTRRFLSLFLSRRFSRLPFFGLIIAYWSYMRSYLLRPT